jgi:phosphoglycerol transferase MdoB-like AlkP superfamily enzyme
LAEKQDGSTPDVISQACSYYQVSLSSSLFLLALTHVQKAAGCFSFMNSLESLQDFRSVSQMNSEEVLEFSEQLLIGLQQLMIAQAQQGAWRKAVMGMNFIQFRFSYLSHVTCRWLER